MAHPPAPLYHDPPGGDKAGIGLDSLQALLAEFHQTAELMDQAVKALGEVVARAEAAHRAAVTGLPDEEA